MSKGSAAIVFRASLMDSCSAHRDAGNHPDGNSPQKTLQIDGHEPSQRPVGPSQIIGPIGCPDLQLQLVALLLVGLPEHFLAVFSFCLIVLKEALQIFSSSQSNVCFCWLCSGVPAVQKGSMLIQR